jgi:hypothetical protein
MSDAEDEWIPSDAASEQLEDEEEEEEEGEDEEVDIEIQEEEPDDEEEDLIDDTPLEEIDYDNVAVVYLDRPIKNKSRRHEYEPFVNSVIHNISPAAMISCSVEPTPFERSSQDTTEQEQFAMASIFEGSPQFESEYPNVRNYLISRYNSNPFVYLSVPDCHVALGKPDFACLVATHQLLEYLGLINHIVLYANLASFGNKLRCKNSVSCWLVESHQKGNSQRHSSNICPGTVSSSFNL